MGVNHCTQGTETVNAIYNLALFTGNIGRAGAAPFSITGQCNAMGTREAGFASSLPGLPQIRIRRIAPNWPPCGTSPKRDSQTRGLAYPDIIEGGVGRQDPRLVDHRHQSRGLVSESRRPAAGALEPEFLVVQDGFHPTPTTELADLVLPAAIWGEKEGTYTNSERRVSKVNAAVAPPGEARSDFDIFLASPKLGCREELFPGWQRPARRLRRMEARLRGRLCDYSGLTLTC